MSSKYALPALLLITGANAQGSPLSSLLSEAQSIYTVVTSALASTPTTTSSSASLSSLSSSTSSLSSIQNTAAAAASSNSPSTTSSAAAQSSNAAASSSNGGSNTLAIVLGVTLGVLALASLIAICLLCRRRRNKKKALAAGQYRSKSTSDDEEYESWRHEKPRVSSFKGPAESVTPVLPPTTAVSMHHNHRPLINEQAYNGTPQQSNFNDNSADLVAPVSDQSITHPRTRILAPHQYDTYPYGPGDVQGHHLGDNNIHENAPFNHAGTTGAAGLAVAGLAAHHAHENSRPRSLSRGRRSQQNTRFEDESYLDGDRGIRPLSQDHRHLGSVKRASLREPWPFESRRSTEANTTRPRSMSGPRNHDSHPIIAAAGGAAVGGAATAASHRHSASKSPHGRKGILKQTVSDTSSSGPSSMGDNYATPNRFALTPSNLSAHDSGPHELAGAHIPPAPVTRSRRNTILGEGAPTAATGSYIAEDAHSRQHLPHDQHDRGIESVEATALATEAVHHHNRQNSHDHYGYHTYGNDRPDISNRSTHHSMDAMPPNSTMPPRVRGHVDPPRIASPVSPITDSNPGTLTNAETRRLGQAMNENRGQNISEGSTAVGDHPYQYHGYDKDGNTSEESRNSGLLNTINRVFTNEGKNGNTWPDEEKGLEYNRNGSGDLLKRPYHDRGFNALHSNPNHAHLRADNGKGSGYYRDPVTEYGNAGNPFETGSVVSGSHYSPQVQPQNVGVHPAYQQQQSGMDMGMRRQHGVGTAY